MSDAQQDHLPQVDPAPAAVIPIATRYRFPAAIIGLVVAPFAGSYASIALYLVVAGVLIWAGYDSPGSLRCSPEAGADSEPTRERLPVRTMIACVLCLLFMMPQHGGVMLLGLLPLLALYLPYVIGVMWGQPRRRMMHAIRLSLWVITVAAISGMHWHYYHAAQADADAAVAAVMSYHAFVGEYPVTLTEAGLTTERELHDKWHLSYSGRGHDPFMMYHSTFRIFCVRDYNFKSKTWGGQCS